LDIVPLPGFHHEVLVVAQQLLNGFVALRYVCTERRALFPSRGVPNLAASHRPKLLTKRKLIQPMATRCIELLCSVTQQEIRPPDIDIAGTAVRVMPCMAFAVVCPRPAHVRYELLQVQNNDTPVHMLLTVLDNIATGVPPKHTFQPITTQLAQVCNFAHTLGWKVFLASC
jgi:hypothetical protein